MPDTADVIVIGLGAMGGAAFHQLAKRGVSVVGIEQFAIAHDRGSSHGETRIIRKAYFEHPDYVPLLFRAYELWRELESAIGRRLYHESGLLIAGPPEGEAVPGARLSARRHGVAIENLTREERTSRFSWLRLPESVECLFEPEAGFVEVERCVTAQVREGERCGGRVVTGERVVSWSSTGSTVRVETDRRQYQAGSLVVAGGPWAAQLLCDLNLPFEVVRKPVVWFPVMTEVAGASARLPLFIESDARAFYGVPSIDGRSMKVAEHTGGELVTDPLDVDRALRSSDIEPLQEFIRARLPGIGLEPLRHSVCMYTLTPDRHFLIDHHPAHTNVIMAAGFSGHGFKFAPVVGEALADLAMRGQTGLPIGFLRRRW